MRTGDHPNAKAASSNDPTVNDGYLWNYIMSEVEVVEKVEEPKFRKITRVPRPGDYVRIIRSTFYFDTDPNLYIKIRSVSTDGSTVIGFYVNHNDHPLAVKENLNPDGGMWCYLSCMDKFEFYEKVEDDCVTFEGVKYRKIDRVPKKGDYVRLIKSCYDFDKPDTMLKLHYVYCDDDRCFGFEVKHRDNSNAVEFLKDDQVSPNYKWNYNDNFSKFEFYEKV